MNDVPESKMSLVGHLSELRFRLVRGVLAVFIGFFVAYGFHMELFDLIVHPVRDALAERGLYQLQALHVTESIFVYLKLSLVVGIMGSFPYLLYQIWAFIAPGLLAAEKRYVTPVVTFSTAFFALGVLFAYTVLLPFITGFLTDLTMSNGAIELQVTVQNVFSFSLLLLLLFGIVFQLPILMFFLTLLGVVNYRQFIDFFRYFIVLAFVIGAMLTPPEPVSQVMMALPMILLYGLGIVIAFMVGERKINEETGEMAPIGARLWLTVCGVLFFFIGGILGTVWLLQPGPKATDLIPVDTYFAAGINPSQTEVVKLGDTILDSLSLAETPKEALTKLLENEEARVVVLFQTGTGNRALVLPEKLIEESTFPTLFTLDSESEFGDGMTHREGKDAPTLLRLAQGWYGLGHPAALNQASECSSEPTLCLAGKDNLSSVLADIRTQGPGWMIVSAANGEAAKQFPEGREADDLSHISAVLTLKDGVDVKATLHLQSEAAARAYKTRVDLWRDQSNRAVLEEKRSSNLTQDLNTIVTTLSALTDISRETLKATVATLSPEARSQFSKKEKELLGKLETLEKQAEALVRKPETTEPTPQKDSNSFVATIPAIELKDWTLATDENTAIFHIRVSSTGLSTWLESLAQAPAL